MEHGPFVQTLLFIIDSGASVNVLADWYARLAEISRD
jgi:hypothetical protein